jgi:hypothetical protein
LADNPPTKDTSMDALNVIDIAGGSQSLADHFDLINTALRYQCLSSPGVVIGTTSAAAVRINATTAYLFAGEFRSRTAVEVAFTATTHDIAASASSVQEACYLLCLDSAGTGSLVMGDVASGSGNAKWPDHPGNLTPVGGVRVAVAAGATSFDASTDLLSAGHITDTFYSFGYFGPRFDSAI